MTAPLSAHDLAIVDGVKAHFARHPWDGSAIPLDSKIDWSSPGAATSTVHNAANIAESSSAWCSDAASTARAVTKSFRIRAAMSSWKSRACGAVMRCILPNRRQA